MAKKKSSARKPTGAATIRTIEDVQDEFHDDDTIGSESSPADQEPVEQKAAKPLRKKKAAESQSGDNLSLSDVRKAAAFANSVGGLDKAIALLQILKVAKEVQ